MIPDPLPDALSPIDYDQIPIECPLCHKIHAEMFCPPVASPSRPEVRRATR